MKTKEQLVEKYREYFGSYSGLVFNGHVNDAHKRAKLLMEIICPSYLKEIEKTESEHGIMSIFDTSPCSATTVYVALVSAFVLEA